MGVAVALSCREYDQCQQPTFVYIHIKDISQKKNSLEVEMHTGIPWINGVIYWIFFIGYYTAYVSSSHFKIFSLSTVISTPSFLFLGLSYD